MSILKIAGVPVTELADTYGTPVIVYDEKMIEDRLREYTESFVSDRFDTEIVYASKAFTCRAMIEKISAAGASLDVVSSGEMLIAKESGMDMKNVYFHGNNKTAEELEICMETGCGNIVLDNRDEVRELIAAAEKSGRSINAMLRINPCVEAHTHEFIVTAAEDSKFGIAIDDREAVRHLIELAQSSKNINFMGFHCHIGSQIFGSDAFEKAAEKLFAFMSEMKELCGYEGKWLSLGGGFGIRYTQDDRPIPVSEMCGRLIDKCTGSGYPLEKVMIEPGRSVAGEAGTTLYRTGYEKMAGDKRYLFVDGGMGDNIRPALYGAEYDADIANRMGSPRDTEYCVAGKYCESGDVLIKKINLQKAEESDILAVYATGAYGYSMASCYNGIGKPAVVFVKDGMTRQIIRRETYRDLMRLGDSGDTVKFSKYHGCGNSFVIVTEEEAGGRDHSELAKAMCSEPTGIGADGLIIVRRRPELEMIFYNRDGSRAPMCGNGIRCFARYCRDERICREKTFSVKTLAGTMIVDVISEEPYLVEIDMGKPDFDPAACSINSDKPFFDVQLELEQGSCKVSTFFMGTVHTVLFVDDFESIDAEKLGREICHHEAYPENTNVNMAKVLDDHTIELKTYERGVGMTCACGTGACASVVWAIHEGRCGNEADVLLPYGTLHIKQKENGEVMMTGPASFSADGEYRI